MLSDAERDREEVHQRRWTFHQAVVQGLLHRRGLLQTAVHADQQRGSGVGALLECFDHGDVVEGAGPLLHLSLTDLPEDTSLHCIIELLVELLCPILLVQSLFH